MTTAAHRKVPFPELRASKAFNDSFSELVNEGCRQLVDDLIPPQNRHTYFHGHGVTQRRADGTPMTTEVIPHRAATTLKLADVIEANLAALPGQALSIVAQLRTSLVNTMYERVAEAAEEAGNVVDAGGKEPTEAVLEMLRKVEFSVTPSGEVSRPSFGPPEAARKIVAALASAGPEFQAELNRIIAEKDAQALAREQERLARFKVRPVDQ